MNCNAIAPAFAVKIGGVVFSVDKRDMIMDDGTGQGTCQGGVSDGGTYAPYVLGDVFMKNAMVVFDVGASELRFRSRLVISKECKFLVLANNLKGTLLNERTIVALDVCFLLLFQIPKPFQVATMADSVKIRLRLGS